ncbi:collagen alpha-6(VI) chain-like, partial [Saccostrea cucullata]|uniref:collagen alpha-6(VI) chain-like n=1 Tax=Saccostrea cuccullata TaxID=36930 RepID=UPI002ED437A5
NTGADDEIVLKLYSVLINPTAITGIDPSSTLITDLKAIAGDDSRYWQVSSPADLYPKFNDILQKIAVCPTTPLPDPVTVGCKLDIAFIIERYNMRFSKTFLAGLMEDIPISSDGVRVGFVTYDSVASKEFGLMTYTSSESARGAIENVPDRTSSYHFAYKGLITARDSVFTALDDREDANNHYVFVVGPFYSETAAVSREIRASGNNFVFAAHIGSSFQSEYQESVDSCGNYTRYTNADSYDNLMSIRQQFIEKITSCEAIIGRTQDCKIDMAFIIDDTDAVTASKFQEMKTFLVSLVTKMVIGDNAIKVGVVTYGNGADIAFTLKQYPTVDELITAIGNIAPGSTAYSRSRRSVDKAILHTLWYFFTKTNGDRPDARNFYVVVTYGGSYQFKDAAYWEALHYNFLIDLFILGVSVPASYDPDFEGAVSEGRYIKTDDFKGLSCNSEVVISNITHCHTEEAPTLAPPSCKLDIVFIIENYKMHYTKRFITELLEEVPVSSDGIRVGLVTYDSTASKQFGLLSYSTSQNAIAGIEGVTEITGSDHLVYQGLIEARDNVFTSAGGDREDSNNYYVFIVGPFDSNTAPTARDIRSSGNNYIYAVHVGGTYQTEYQECVDSCGNYTRYTDIAEYDDLLTIRQQIVANITSCEEIKDITQALIKSVEYKCTTICLSDIFRL